MFSRVAVRAFSGVGEIVGGDDRPGLSVLAGWTAVDLRSWTCHLRAAPSAGHAEEDVYAPPTRCAAGWAPGSEPDREALGGSGDDHLSRGAGVSPQVVLDASKAIVGDRGALSNSGRQLLDGGNALVDRMYRADVRPDDELVVGKVGLSEEFSKVAAGFHTCRGCYDIPAGIPLPDDDPVVVIDEHDDLAVGNDKWHCGMWPNASFGGQAEGAAGGVHPEACLCNCGLKGRPLARDVAREGAERIGIDRDGFDAQTDVPFKRGSDEGDLSVLGGKDGNQAGVRVF